MHVSHLYVYQRLREAIKSNHSIKGRRGNQDNPASTFHPNTLYPLWLWERPSVDLCCTRYSTCPQAAGEPEPWEQRAA